MRHPPIPHPVHILLLSAILFLSGCASSLHVQKHQRLQEPFTSTITVHVTNPELAEQFAILKQSGIYKIAEIPSPETHALTLQPTKPQFVCFTGPGAALIMTLGLIPIPVPTPNDFSYTLTKDGITQEFTHRLYLYTRFSVWEWFFRKKHTTVMSQALRHSRRDTPSSLQSKSPFYPTRE